MNLPLSLIETILLKQSITVSTSNSFLATNKVAVSILKIEQRSPSIAFVVVLPFLSCGDIESGDGVNNNRETLTTTTEKDRNNTLNIFEFIETEYRCNF